MKYDIELLKRKMLVKYPFFGSVVANVCYKENKDIPTAGTDGETIYYNSEYLDGLSLDEQTFIFAHEVCHIAFNHILRSEGKNPELWNIATDGVINQFLKRDGLKIPQGGVDIAEAINYDAEQIYEKLLQEKQQSGQGNRQQNSGGSQDENNHQQSQSQQDNGETQNQESKQQNSGGSQVENNHQQSQSQQQCNSGSGSSKEQENQSQEHSCGESGKCVQKEDKSKQDVGHDTHSMWEQAVKKRKEQQEKTNKQKSLLDKLLGTNKDKKDKEKNELEKKQEDLENMGEKNAFKKNRDVKKKQLEELKESILKQASKAGNSTNSDIRTVNDIGYAKPLIDWRYILKEAIKYDVDWSYQNATIENGVVSANLEEQPFPETEIVLDTSGSINEVLLRNFLRECKNILKHSKLKVGCFDTKFYGFTEIRTEEDLENMKFLGGGGTNFDAAVNAFSRRVENKIVFTDGEALMPKMTLDAVWIVFGNKKINPKGGKVINITQEQLDRLYSFEINNAYNRKTR